MIVMNDNYLPDELYKMAHYYGVKKLLVVPPNKSVESGCRYSLGRWFPEHKIVAINPWGHYHEISGTSGPYRNITDLRFKMWLGTVETLIHEVYHMKRDGIVDARRYRCNIKGYGTYEESMATQYARIEMGRLLKLDSRLFMPKSLMVLDALFQSQWNEFRKYNFSRHSYNGEGDCVCFKYALPMLEHIRCIAVGGDVSLTRLIDAMTTHGLTASRRSLWKIATSNNIGRIYIDMAGKRRLFFTLSECDQISNIIKETRC